ncbi:MAG: replicative DNA helicase [Bacteroidales bacterium]
MDENTLEITERSEVFEFASLRQKVNQALQQNFGENQISNGLSSGFRDIDQVISGFKKGQLTTIAVKPGMGKTALMLSIANNVAIKNNHSVAIFSPERSSTKITNRLIESETGMSLDKLINGKLKASEKDHMFTLVSHIARANMFLDDTPNLSAYELQQKTRQLKNMHNVDLIIIDYLELLSTSITDNDNRKEQLSKIVQIIKDIAKELNIPIVLFSQIPGSYSQSISKRPEMKDLPAYLTELSDVIMLLHRSDLYNRNNPDNDNQNLVEVVIGKYENYTDENVVPLRYIESLAKFTDK